MIHGGITPDELHDTLRRGEEVLAEARATLARLEQELPTAGEGAEASTVS